MSHLESIALWVQLRTVHWVKHRVEPRSRLKEETPSTFLNIDFWTCSNGGLPFFREGFSCTRCSQLPLPERNQVVLKNTDIVLHVKQNAKKKLTAAFRFLFALLELLERKLVSLELPAWELTMDWSTRTTLLNRSIPFIGRFTNSWQKACILRTWICNVLRLRYTLGRLPVYDLLKK